MAYNQGYYQEPPSQRPYAGRAAQRPGPPQGYNQPPPSQQYPPQQYDQYPQDNYRYDNYNDGYAQDYNYQDANGGGRGNGYPPQGYRPNPPQQDYYGNDRGRGGGPAPSTGRGGPPMQRPPPGDQGMRGGYGGGQGRGYPEGGPPAGRGGRPVPLQHASSSESGSRPVRKPLKTPPISPDQPPWDNPFPTFPGTKKKTSTSEEQAMLQKMATMDMGAPASRPKTGKGSPDRYPRGVPADDFGRPSIEGKTRQGSLDEYDRPPSNPQRNMPPRGYPQQGPPQQDSRRGPSPQNGYGGPGYDSRGGYGPPGPTSPIRDNFGPSRSMTMPNDPAMTRGPAPRQPPMPLPGPGAAYGQAGRGMPPRPSTATGARPPPQRQYPPENPYAVGGYGSQAPDEGISDFYDSYYDEGGNGAPRHNRSQSFGSENPNINPNGGPRRGPSDGRIPPGPGGMPPPQGGYQQVKPVKSQPDFRGRAQPQAAVFDMAGDTPPLPNANPQAYQGDPYAKGYNDPANMRSPLAPQPYGGYDDPAAQQNGYPPRGGPTPRGGPPGMAGLPSGPKAGFGGLPNVPAPLNGGTARNNSLPKQMSPNGEALPSHPVPVRPGQIPNSVANQAMNRPPPVRNYDNVSPGSQASSKPADAAAEGPPPVTVAELEQLKEKAKMNLEDQNAQLLLARKLVEASEVLVPTIPDQRARNKARERYVMDAHKLLKKLVAVQNPEAMFYLADCHGRGALGLEVDNKEAFSLYQSAAKAGHAAAAYRTAVCCEVGNEEGGGTRKDPQKAIQWYKRAAMLGDTPAMYKMGMIQLKGLLGTPKNPREAVGWLKRAAERADAENPHALHELGLLYEAPQGTDNSILHDEAYSFSLFQQAADLGYKFSQFRLGSTFEYGLFGQPIDPRRSIMWYSRAAVQEEHQSELALSGWYLTGSEGVLQQSDTEAYLWARKAAIAGLAKAEYAMGYFTEVGIGAPANLEDAKRWYWRAAAQNFPKARERLEDLKRGGSRPALKSRERISRSKVGKQNEGECSVM